MTRTTTELAARRRPMLGRFAALIQDETPNPMKAISPWRSKPTKAASSTSSGTELVNLRMDVSDAKELIAAGRRSYGRSIATWLPGDDVVMHDDADEVIVDPAQAIVDLLVEAWERCYGSYTTHGPFIEAVPSAQWGDVDDKQWYLDAMDQR